MRASARASLSNQAVKLRPSVGRCAVDTTVNSRRRSRRRWFLEPAVSAAPCRRGEIYGAHPSEVISRVLVRLFSLRRVAGVRFDRRPIKVSIGRLGCGEVFGGVAGCRSGARRVKEQWRWMSCTAACVCACVRGGAISRPPGPPPPPPASRHLETCYEIVMIGTHRGASIAKALPRSR